MKIDSFLFLIVFLFLSFFGKSQVAPETVNFLFYNVENLFDTGDNPKTEDDEFTPTGDRHWTFNRLNNKLIALSKVILNSSGFYPPALIGLCEVENREVVEKLLTETPLNEYPYKIIHKESPDYRGIDVVFLYNEEVYYPLQYQYYPLTNDEGEIRQSREILYVSGILNNTDTVHFFVNHWPSRYDGLLETTHERILAANTLIKLVKQQLTFNPQAKIVITGDFNDQPGDESITMLIDAFSTSNQTENKQLYNLSADWLEEELGTLKYQSQWFVFDQFIVSGTLLNGKTGFQTSPENASILDFPFLLEQDERYGGLKPKRTYTGYSYNGGFSDHLPILLELVSIDD